VYCNTRELIEQGVLGIVIGVVIGRLVTKFIDEQERVGEAAERARLGYLSW